MTSVAEYPTNEAGYPTTVEGCVAAAERVLRSIPRPATNDGAAVVWRVSDDVPENLCVALSYVSAARAMLAARPAPTLDEVAAEVLSFFTDETGFLPSPDGTQAEGHYGGRWISIPVGKLISRIHALWTGEKG